METSIRCSIPGLPSQDYFREKIKEKGFHENKIEPDNPGPGEYIAFRVFGIFDGTQEEFNNICQEIIREWNDNQG